jgi:multidrug efflux pump subunit AcrA (membrane-fusion protein)
MKHLNIYKIIVSCSLLLVSCGTNETKQEIVLPAVAVKTTSVKLGTIEEYITRNAKTVYLGKNNVYAPISAFVKKVNVKYGDVVNKDDVLYLLQTKENRALKEEGSDLKVIAPSNGTITSMPVNNENVYVSEGQELCSIAENRDVVVEVYVSYNSGHLIKAGTECMISLPDNTVLDGRVFRILPSVNEADQTVTVLVRTVKPVQLPENLNISARFIVNKHHDALLIDKNAVMANEEQTDFWVMRIYNDSIAVKTPIRKGIENDTIVELTSGNLTSNDIIITEGAFGLPDSSVVKISR